MSKFLKTTLTAVSMLTMMSVAKAADAEAGAKVFKKCGACHAVGDGAKNKVGPQLNEIIGRAAGSVEGFKYSSAMVTKGAEGLVWDNDSLTQYLANPKGFVKGTRMAFAGLKKEDELADVVAYLATFSSDGDAAEADPAAQETPKVETAAAASEPTSEEAPKVETAAAPSTDNASAPAMVGEKSKGKFGLGRLATTDEVSAWDIDIRPDGKGLPEGSGTVAQGEPIYTENCASCHGDFGEAVDRWPVLAGGQDTLTDDRPVKTVGSYWPHLSTVYDYVRRAMPFGNARSLSDDDVYALTAYILYLNDIVEDEDFELSSANFNEIEMPNAANFIPDDRDAEPQYANKAEACMSDCKPEAVTITKRAQVLDVTPDGDGDGAGAIE